MYDKPLSLEILKQIHQSTLTILKRFESVESVDAFTGSEAGMEKMDSICMQLIAIGESLKNLDKVTDQTLLPNYPQIDWKKAKALRDIISHHYFDLNAEAIYDVCKKHIPCMEQTIKKIVSDMSQ
jgi:uncharacterized protein with HEPN domain